MSSQWIWNTNYSIDEKQINNYLFSARKLRASTGNVETFYIPLTYNDMGKASKCFKKIEEELKKVDGFADQDLFTKFKIG